MVKVKLRSKKLADGKRESLYLDFYPPIPNPETGKPTRREFLELYILEKPRTPVDKLENKKTIALAEAIRGKRQVALQNGHYGFLNREMQKIDFVQYFKELSEKRKKNNHDNWVSAFYYFEKFTGGALNITHLNEKLCNDYREFILTAPSQRSNKQPLVQNSASSYFNKFKATLKQAFKDGLIQIDLNSKIEPIKYTETKIIFLTQEELQTLSETECPNATLRNSALFASLTGMAFNEIKNLFWGDIEFTKEYGYFIPHKRIKTKRENYLPISDQAYGLLGERKDANQKVFPELCDRDRYHYFPIWVANAGIKKNMTFHCLRHTFATIQLLLGTDLYTLSKLLGHSSIKTTQIYAEVVHKLKREASNRIKLNLNF